MNLAENRVQCPAIVNAERRVEFLKAGNFFTFLSDYQHLKEEPTTTIEQNVLKIGNCYMQCIK